MRDGALRTPSPHHLHPSPVHPFCGRLQATSARPGARLAFLSTKPDVESTDTQPKQPDQKEQKADNGASASPVEPQAGETPSEFESASAPSVAQMADLIAEKDVKLVEVTDKYRRALAEMENVRARSRRDVDNAYKYSIQGFAKDLLEVADNLNRALDNVDRAKLDDNADLKTLFEGLQMTETGLGSILQRYGVEKLPLSAGAVFDPNFHTAIFQQESAEATPGTIASVVSSGYMFKDRVLRPAAVGTFKQAAAAVATPAPKSDADKTD